MPDAEAGGEVRELWIWQLNDASPHGSSSVGLGIAPLDKEYTRKQSLGALIQRREQVVLLYKAGHKVMQTIAKRPKAERVKACFQDPDIRSSP